MANSQKAGFTSRRRPPLAEQQTDGVLVGCTVRTTGVCYSAKEENLPNSMLSRSEKALLRLRNGEMKLQGDWIGIKHLYYVWINTRAARSKETYILHVGVTEEGLCFRKSTGSAGGSGTEKSSSSPCCEFLKFLRRLWPRLWESAKCFGVMHKDASRIFEFKDPACVYSNLRLWFNNTRALQTEIIVQT